MRPDSARDSRRPRALPKGRGAALTIAAATGVMLLAAVGLRLASRGEAFSHRVVVSAMGCGAPCDAQVARSLADELKSLGFDAVAPRGLEAPDSVRTFAREHGARFGIMLLMAVEQSTALDDTGRRVGANVALYVIDAESEEAPQPSFVLRGIEEASDERTALSILGLRLLHGLSPLIGSALLTSAPVRALQENASGLEQQAAALALKRHQKHVQAREQAIREYRLHCESNDEALEARDDGRCVSNGCAEEYLVGVLPDASAAVVHDSTDAAVFPLAPDSTARGFSTSERLWLVPRTGERSLLAEATNFYSRPDLSRDGGTLAFIEFRLGRSRLYAQALDTRERLLIQSLEMPRHFSEPRLAPDGAHLLYYQLEERRGRAALWIAETSSAGRSRELLPHALDARFVRLSMGDGSDRLLVAALVPGTPETTTSADGPSVAAEHELERVETRTPQSVDTAAPFPALLLIDPHSSQVIAREDRLSHHVRAIGDSHRGELLLSFEDRACGFARYAPGKSIAWHRTELCPKHIEAGGDGVLAHALVTDGGAFRQLVRLDVDGGKLELLTRSSQDVQNPKLAATSAGYAYERVMPRKYGELQHVAVCFDTH